MVTIRPDGAPATRGAIDGSCATNGEPLKASPQRHRHVGLDNQMNAIDLNREMNHAKGGPVRRAERAAQAGKNARGPQRWDAAAAAEGHMDGMAQVVPGPASVRNARTKARGSASRAATASGPTSAAPGNRVDGRGAALE